MCWNDILYYLRKKYHRGINRIYISEKNFYKFIREERFYLTMTYEHGFKFNNSLVICQPTSNIYDDILEILYNEFSEEELNDGERIIVYTENERMIKNILE